MLGVMMVARGDVLLLVASGDVVLVVARRDVVLVFGDGLDWNQG